MRPLTTSVFWLTCLGVLYLTVRAFIPFAVTVLRL